MEFIEGETLADRLTKGALPLEQALAYGIQIADGLDKASGGHAFERPCGWRNLERVLQLSRRVIRMSKS